MGNDKAESKSLLGKNNNGKKVVEKEPIGKSVAFITIGTLTMIYVIVELAAALYLSSLALLSDGFHNLSDVVSLVIAWWAQKAAKRDSDNNMSYGWARAEILGGLTNGCFLVSMSLYVALEAIPRLFKPVEMESGLIFMIVAGTGLAINILGTIVFALTGMSHAHSHGGGGGHSHAHGGEAEGVNKNKKEKHGHAHGEKKEKKDKGEHDHHAHTDEAHGHAHGEKKEKKEKHGHGHSHGSDGATQGDHHDHSDESHGHAHGEKKEKKEKHGHGHAHGDKKESGGDHGHSHGQKKDKKKKKGNGTCLGMDLNMFGVFIHFLGDAVSSLFVLITGAVIHFTSGKWTLYIDPAVSLVIVAMIAATSIPLVKRCSMILLQKVPDDIDLDGIRSKMLRVDGVVSQHDLHVWQLVDGMTIASVHVGIQHDKIGSYQSIANKIKKIFHKEGIHSTSIQPEFVSDQLSSNSDQHCIQNCVEECEEEWCCKKSADRIKMRNLAHLNVNSLHDEGDV